MKTLLVSGRDSYGLEESRLGRGENSGSMLRDGVLTVSRLLSENQMSETQVKQHGALEVGF